MIRRAILSGHGRRDSPVHRLPALPKAAALLGCLVAVALWSGAPPVFHAAMAGSLLLVAAAARLPARFLLGRMLALMPFALGISALSLFQPGGMHVFLGIATRSALCLFALVLLSATTPFSGLLRLARRARLPPLMVTTLALAWRYAFVLAEEAHRMQRTRLARCFNPARRREARWRAVLLGRLLLRTMDRSGRVYSAMLARGWR